MKANNLILGGRFAYPKRIGAAVSVITILGFERKGVMYNVDSYTGTEILIFEDGECVKKNWALDAKIVENRIIEGIFIRLR